MQFYAPLALVLAGLLGLTAHARPCDEHSSSSVSVYAPPTQTAYPTASKTHWSDRPVTETDTVTVSTTISRTTTLTDTITSTRTSVATYTPAPTSQWSAPSSSLWSSSSSHWSSASSWSSTPTVTQPSSAVPSATGSSSGGQCNTGPVQCCNSVQNASDPGAANILQSLGLVLGESVPVGLTCSPLNVLGVGSGGNCASTPVCCENNHSSGLISISCIPIIIQL